MARMAAKRKREIKIPNKRRIFSKSVRHRCILYTDTWNDEAVAPNRWIALLRTFSSLVTLLFVFAGRFRTAGSKPPKLSRAVISAEIDSGSIRVGR